MLEKAIEVKVQKIVLTSLFCVTIFVTPWWNLDPINLSKFCVLVVCGLTVLGNLATNWRILFSPKIRLVSAAILFFILALFLSLFFSGSQAWSQIYGTFGRNTGLLSYFALAIMLISVAVTTNENFATKILLVLIFTGVLNAVYGLIQWFGHDPINWNNPYNPIIGTLGNPNFLSAHLGISSVASFALFMDQGLKLRRRLFYLAYPAFAMYLTFNSDSSQGIAIFFLGCIFVFYFHRVMMKHWILNLSFLLITIGIVALGALGLINKGPLAAFIFEDSITYRKFYWLAGWKMTVANPIFGVGLDSYGNWYRFFRDQEMVTLRGPDITTNSAHNVFLDISSNGGFTLLAAYLLIMALIINSSFRIILVKRHNNTVGLAIVGAWFAYLIQSVVSINQLGLAIWGWVLGGAIIGYDLHLREKGDYERRSQKESKRLQVSATTVLTGFLGLITGLTVALWPFIQDMKFRNAIQVGDINRIDQAVNSFPRNNYYFVYAAQLLVENKNNAKALDYSRLAIGLNPRDFNAWSVYFSNPELSESEKLSSLERMKELDPLNGSLDGG